MRNVWVGACFLVAMLTVPTDAAAQRRGPIEMDELLGYAEWGMGLITETRRVPDPGPVRFVLVDREELRAHLDNIWERDVPAAWADAYSRLAISMAWVPVTISWTEVGLETLERNVIGFYDPVEKLLLVVADVPRAEAAGVVMHELYHAMQDHFWDLEGRLDRTVHVTDAATAELSLIEGDAMAVVLRAFGADVENLSVAALISELAGESLEESRGETPGVMWEQTVFPYYAGTEFVLQILSHGGWQAVNALYDDPPISTEQLLHPQRYLHRDDPTWLTYDVSGLSHVISDVHGEHMILATCDELLGETGNCERAAAGWDGDHVSLWEDEEGGEVMVWASVWDGERNAREFADSLVMLGQPLVGARMTSLGEGAHGAAWSCEGVGGTLFVERWGDLVLTVVDRRREQGDGPSIDAIVNGVWATLERSAYPDLDR